MPNWCFNTLTIQGPKEQVDFIKDKLNQPFDVPHSSWNTETQEMEDSIVHYSSPVFSFMNIHSPFDNGISVEDYSKQPVRSELSPNDKGWWADTQAKAKVDKSWYAFNNREWGTKWDVAVSDDEQYPNTELIEHMSNDEDQWLVYKFETAWAPPQPAMEKLSALVPNCVLTLDWEEEQGFGGEIEFVNGQITAESSYDEKCYECDAIDNMDYCEECEVNVCLSCGYTREEEPCEHQKGKINV